MRRRAAIEAVAALLVLGGLLAYVLIDPYATSTQECDDTEPGQAATSTCRASLLEDPGGWQLFLVLAGLAGLGVLLVSGAQRLRRRGRGPPPEGRFDDAPRL